MTTTRLIARVDPETKKLATHTAARLGVTTSALIQATITNTFHNLNLTSETADNARRIDAQRRARK